MGKGLHHLLFNKEEEIRRDPLSWEPGRTEPNVPPVKRLSQRKEKETMTREENGVQTRFKDLFIQRIRVEETKEAEGAEEISCC